MSALRRIFPILLISLSGAIFFFSCATAPAGPEPAPGEEPGISLEEETYRGVSYYAATGDPSAAISAFERAKRKAPDDPETRVLYSSLLLAVGQFDEAKAELDAVLAEDPQNINALYNLSLVQGAAGDREARESTLEDILSIDSGEPRANASLGELYLERKEYSKAKDSFQRSIESEPKNFVARLGYGNALRRTEAYKESLEQFDEAARIDPDYSFVYADRARSKLRLSNPKGAEEDLSKAIEALPDHYWHYIDRGKVRLIDLASSSLALEDFNRAVEINPGLFYAYVYRGGILIDLGHYSEALNDLEFVISKRPDYFPVYPDLAMLYVLEKRYAEARNLYGKSIEQDRDNPGFKLMVGALHFLEGDADEGTKYFMGIVNSFPRDSGAYHVARTFVEPGYEGTALRKIKEEKQPLLKSQMFFYLGLYYMTHDMSALGETLLMETADANILSLRETRLAREFLKRRGVIQ
jgi:tetratricopeptide (TPR) repeat protein